MKKMLCTVLCIALILLCCAAPAEEAVASELAMTDLVPGETTIGVITAAGLELQAFSYGSDGALVAVYLFSDGPARVTAQGTEEQMALMEALSQTEFDIDEIEAHRAQEDAILGTFVIASVEDLTGGIMSDEALAALAGKTARELLDSGFTEDQVWFNEDTNEIVFDLVADGFYRYSFFADCDYETFDSVFGEDEMYAMTVKGAAFSGITSDAAGGYDLSNLMYGMEDIMSSDNFLDMIREGVSDGSISQSDLSMLLNYLTGMLPEGSDLGDIKEMTTLEIIEKVMQYLPKDIDIFGGLEED